jgi:hypothetical protein
MFIIKFFRYVEHVLLKMGPEPSKMVKKGSKRGQKGHRRKKWFSPAESPIT